MTTDNRTLIGFKKVIDSTPKQVSFDAALEVSEHIDINIQSLFDNLMRKELGEEYDYRQVKELIETYQIEDIEVSFKEGKEPVVSYFANGDFDPEKHDKELTHQVISLVRESGAYESTEGKVISYQFKVLLMDGNYVIEGLQMTES